MTMFMSDPHNYSSHQLNNRSPEEVKELTNKFDGKFYEFCNKHAGKNIIASAEDMTLISEHDLTNMKVKLGDMFDDYLIVGYVRPPNSLMTSSFQQRVAGGISAKRLFNLYPHYRQKLEKFDNVFGQDHVSLTRFDRGTLFENGVVLGFSKKLVLFEQR